MAEQKRILIIEDSPPVREMLNKLFTDHDYIVSSTADGQSALTLAHDGGFTAILLDLKMPRMNGLEFLRSLQTNPPDKPNGPIIVYTSVSDAAIFQQALDAGAAQVLEKDHMEFVKLPETIQQLIDRSAAAS